MCDGAPLHSRFFLGGGRDAGLHLRADEQVTGGFFRVGEFQTW